MFRWFVFVTIVLAGLETTAQKSSDVVAYIATYKDLAISEMKRTGLPAAIKLAQGIHETEAGKSDLVRRSNNHFGIKCKSAWTGGKVFHDDDARGECFRSYRRPEDSYMDHSDFLKNSQRYAFLFDLDPADYEGWAYGLKKAGYATNIRYSQVLIRLIREYDLQDYTMIAMGKLTERDPRVAGTALERPSGALEDKSVKKDAPVEIGVTTAYPSGQFSINNTRVIYAPANTAWLSIAEEYNIPLNRLLDFNDIESGDDLLAKANWSTSSENAKWGPQNTTLWGQKENLYDISQSEGIRHESLLELNQLKAHMQPAAGEKLYLQSAAPSRPLLAADGKSAPPSTDLPDRGKKPTRQPEHTTHFVAGRETLYSISKKYGVETRKIMEWNSLDSMDLRIGQELIIYHR